MRLFDMFEDDIPPLPKKTVAKTWDQMTPQEKISGVKGRTVWNDETRKYRTVFDVPAKSVKEDPNPKQQAAIAIAKKKEQGLKEFALPGGGGGDSGRWYTDDELADIIGDDWFEDFDVSHDEFNIDAYGEKAKLNLAGYANSWFDDKGYNVNVMGVDHNDVDHDLKWYIVGSFQNDNFADKDVDEGAEFGATYAEQLAQKVFNVRPALKNEDDVLNIGYKVAVQDLMSQTRAVSLFSRDQDFPSDYVSAYYYLQKQGVAEAHGNSKIYDKCWTGFRKVPGKTRGEKGSCKEINEFAPAGGDDGDADPYRYPKPEHFSRSVDFFGQFEAGHFDREDMNDTSGEFKGYWGKDQIAYFKFDNPKRTGSDDPGMGWYYEPTADGNDIITSANPGVDNSAQHKQQEMSMINAFLKSGQTAKPGSQIYSLMKKHSLAEGSDTVDSLVTDAEAVMKKFQIDAEQALKTVLGNREYNSRRGYYNFYIRQIIARASQQGVAEGADDKFSVADKVEDLVDQYRLYDKRGWTDLFAELAGRKLEVAEIRREMEYASKFLQLLDSIRMRSDYRGQQDPKSDQELIDLSNQWISLFNKATSEFKGMSGQGVAEGFNGEYDDEAGMVKNNIHTIVRVLTHLSKDIDGNENLPEWVQEKIAMIKQTSVEVMNYIISQHEMGVAPSVTDEATNYHANRIGFNKHGRDLSGEDEPTGMFMVMIDGRPWKEFTSNMAFARAKAFATKNPERTVQVRWPNGQLNTIKEDSWHGTGDAWHGGAQGEV